MLVEKSVDNFFKIRFLDEFMAGHKGFIAGGCFKNIFSGEKPKDVDMFFENRSDFDAAVVYFDENESFAFWYENQNVKAYKHIKSSIVVELCCKVFGSSSEILSNFDFTITKFAYFKKEVEDDDANGTHIEYLVMCDDMFFEHLHMKRLVIDDKMLYPVSSFERTIRYCGYGYKPCTETKMKIIEAIRSISEQDVILSKSLYDGID